MKVTVVGAGNVGATCANCIAEKDIVNEVVLLDIKEGVSEGKSLDMWQTAPINLYDTRIKGVTNDYAATDNSEVVVITSSKVFGMAGVLDTARYRAFLAEALNVSPKDIQALLLGGHGDTMVPLPRYTSVGGIPVTELIDADKLQAIIERTKVGGGELVKLMGTSAWYAPGAAAAQMVEAIIRDQKRVFPVCAMLNGEYGMKDIYLGVPVVLGKNGIEKIIEVKLDDQEKELLATSAKAVKSVMTVLDDMKMF